jgi:CheY-like chemotaxis protein
LARRILLADDSVTAQNMGRRILADAGYDVVTVNNGSAALKKIAENKPDLIVLDVYMPGYGGLEVCQRVKENPETRQIPVLLTVGKLEPFKAEEARRVGADSFIIKPFEATELLTVLTKLEDKIVAQPQPQKSGRFAKALAAVEQSDTGQRFGDKETGWKNRLTIPNPQAKTRAEEEASEAVAASSRAPGSPSPDALDAVKPVEAHGFERPIPAGLPADITPEEIAAITAAAASFGPQTEPLPAVSEISAQEAASSPEVVSPEATEIQPSPAQMPAADEASAPQLSPEGQVEVPAEAAEAVPGTESAQGEDHKAGDDRTEAGRTEDRAIDERAAGADLATAVASSEPTPSPPAQASGPAQPSAGDAEVMAAIASLAPTNGHLTGGTPSGAFGSGETAQPVSASAVGVELASGPRWIADSVEVGPEESKLVLEQEMELVHAARASVEATTLAAATESAGASAVLAPPEAAVTAESSVAESTATAESLPMAAAESANVESRVSESSISESSISESSVNEPEVSESSAVESVAAPSDTTGASTVPGLSPAVMAEESAFAAAASAGAGAEHVAVVEAVSATSIAPAGQAESVAPREAELAAAWQNWKQIRESLVGSQPPAAAEAFAELNSRHEPATVPAEAPSAEVAAPVEVEAVAADAPEESSAIASIVDTMLAELRPKLVEEIAKKMNSERKEKDKKRKK